MSLDWFPWFPHAFRKKTLHLTLEQDGAYRRLIDEYMIQRGPLPDNDIALSRMLGVSVEHWQSIATVVLSFFERHSGKLVNSRCEDELRAQEQRDKRRSAVSKNAAVKRWAKERKIKGLIASSMPQVSWPYPQRMPNEMPNDATLHKKDITTSLPSSARANSELVENPQEQTNTAGLLATALPAGALARQPETEQAALVANETPSPAEPPQAFDKEARAKLDAMLLSRRKPKEEIDLRIPKFLQRTA